MKNIVRISIITLLFIFSVNSIYSQNLKKAFKVFNEGRYDEAYTIFTSGENMNSCIGIYGEALVLHKKPLKFKESDSEDYKKRKLVDKKLSAYFKVNLSESKIKEVSDKDLKSIKEYFSVEKLSNLKKELESIFMDLGEEDIYLNLINKLKDINKDSKFYSIMETKYVDKEFNKIKSKNTMYGAEGLIKKFPDNQRSKTIQRYVDSIRVEKATGIYSLTKILYDYPENEFKVEIINKIKKHNSNYVAKLLKKKQDYQKILVWLDYQTEDEAIKKLTEWYDYYRRNHNKSPNYYYIELSDTDLKRFNLKNKFLLFEYLDYSNYEWAANRVEKYKSQYKGSYVLDLYHGIQIFSKEKVYKNGKLLNTYGAIYIKMTGKYRFSSDPVYQSMKELITELKEKTKHQVITQTYSSGIKIFPYDNPFPVYIDINELPEYDKEKNAINVFYISSYKKTYLFEIYQDKIDEALDRIMYKIGFYFRD